ncbi:Heptaprenyl diphosphate synthase component 2 [Listeria monocytogenes]|nr:Heptaprenyl diphosphate synthase component 2 [Listeria monocytogenes]
MKLNFLYANMQKDIDSVEKELKKALSGAAADTTSAAALHLLEAGGKRIRPMFVCLSARLAANADFNAVKNASVAIELIHMASIVHDDVVDDADLRRGRETIKSKWGNHIAMYTGDFLFAKSLEYMTEIKDVAAHKMLSHVTVELSTGEIEQLKDKYNFDQSVRNYLRRIKRKTALLIAARVALFLVKVKPIIRSYIVLVIMLAWRFKLRMMYLILLEQKKNLVSQLEKI